MHCSIFSDAKEVVDDLNRGKPYPWATAPLMEDMEKLSKKNRVGVYYVPRADNYIAHNLAKWAASSMFCGSLSKENLPCCVTNLL